MKALVLLTSLLLSASMSPVPDEYTVRHECIPSEEISCIVDSPFVCPPGYIDGCLTNETRHHKCIVKETGPSCELEMNLRCPDNFEDGCLSGKSDIHVCLPVSGPLCNKAPQYTCPSGFVDACQ